MKVKIKGSIFLSLLLSLCLALSVPFSSLADLATDSQALYDSADEPVVSSYVSITPYAVLPYFYIDAVATDGTWVRMNYNASTGLYSTPLNYGKKFNQMMLTITSDSIPKSGTYGVVFHGNEGNIASWGNVSRVNLYLYDSAVNVAMSESSALGKYTRDASAGAFSFSGNVRIGYNTKLVRFAVTFNQSFSDLDINPTGYKFTFTSESSVGTVVSPEIQNSGSSGVDNAIANNTGTLVEQQEETNGLLVQIISTISNQLTAFWNQLAGEFTNLYNKMNQQHQEKLDADRENTDDLINNNNSNTDKITQNQDKNTDQALNGYDPSALDNSSNNLNDTLTEYSELENSITESMESYLDNFEYHNLNNYPSGVLASLLFFGNYIQSIFESLNHFNLPITLGLTLTFVLMLIGYFRYGR